MILRDYQLRAVAGVRSAWESGQRSVCLVAPTGSGKTVMGAALVGTEPALWLVHRRELAAQARSRLPDSCSVDTIQRLAATGDRPEARLVVLDEAHHYRADEWGTIADGYATSRILGLTATPERSDGRPLGDLFAHLVVAASYSELIDAGHLVPCDVWCPPERCQGGLAQRASDAYQAHGEGRQAFVFWSSVAECSEASSSWPDASQVTGDVATGERDQTMGRFRAGELRSLHTVYVLTEGVDVPEASCVVLARDLGHVSQYLQIAGRVLRPAPGKDRAVLVDLTGCALAYGSPTEDRLYSLAGVPIQRAESQPTLRQCLACGWTWEGSSRACPSCGYEHPVKIKPPKRIYSLELSKLDDLSHADAPMRRRELRRLLELVRVRDWGIWWAAKEYRKLFGEEPSTAHMLADTTLDERRREFDRYRKMGREKGYKPTFATARYKATFGVWPR